MIGFFWLDDGVRVRVKIPPLNRARRWSIVREKLASRVYLLVTHFDLLPRAVGIIRKTSDASVALVVTSKGRLNSFRPSERNKRARGTRALQREERLKSPFNLRSQFQACRATRLYDGSYTGVIADVCPV